MPFACIYVPNFPVAAALRAEPELQARAVAMLEGKPPLETIIAVNEKAVGMGIAPGMTKAQAELCAELALRPRSALRESAAHAALLDCAQSFSPCVEDAACDTALLDLAGMESLFGSLPEISRAIYSRAAALGLTANVAVASNPDAAVLAARGLCDAGLCGTGTPFDKLRAGFARVGVAVIPQGKEAEQLGSLPVKVLFAEQIDGEEKKTAARLLETLNRWGIRNLRGLAALPEVSLSERLGQEGLRLQQLARGAASRTLVSVEAPLVFEEAVELEHPIVLLEPLAFLLNRLLEQICARLGSRALATQELRLTLELENFSALNQQSAIKNQQFVRTLRLPLPMLDAKVFLKLLQLDLNAHPPGAPIVKIHLAAEPARPRSAQGGLFLPPSPEPEKLELTLARIAGMVGEDKVGALELLDTHHPEGFRMRRFVAEDPRKSSREKTSDAAEEQSVITALRRFRPPLRAHVTLENGQPTHLVCRNRNNVEGKVLWRAGPWRFSGDWWEREAWSRDEWDIALQNNALRNGEDISFCRLVHDLLGGGWFVEGTYD
ncbi:MAG TPA: DNA polymerase Y family protein [Candidatus Sulfotelmatobacter sp.]|nr:DNA polymerase Y family protein [Candidatus Sulfotelmatobacter sp.]